MKHIKSFNESVIENDIQSLKDIFIHLKDDGYKVEYFSKKEVNDIGILVSSISVKITNPTAVNQIINFTSYDLVCSLKEAVSLMQSLDYKYKARYALHGFSPDRFYIYLDERDLTQYISFGGGLRPEEIKIDETTRPHTIYLDFIYNL
jgi:hypothetical protein